MYVLTDYVRNSTVRTPLQMYALEERIQDFIFVTIQPLNSHANIHCLLAFIHVSDESKL
jgi:hypothetical protein